MLQKSTRRRLLGQTAVAAASLATICTPARAAFEYKMATTDRKDSPTTIHQIQMCEAIKRDTNGRLTISLFPSGVLGTQAGTLTEVRAGAIQFVGNISSVYGQIVPLSGIDGLGFVFKNAQQASSAMEGPLGAYVRSEFSAKGLHVFRTMWESGFREPTNSVRAIRTVEDFSGLKFRVPQSPINVDLFRALGASPVAISPEEEYTALQTHIVDGTCDPILFIDLYKFYEVQKYLSLWHPQYVGYWIVANLEAWNALPGDIQGIVEANVTKYGNMERDSTRKLNASLASKLHEKGMIVNTGDAAGVHARLQTYYARWRNEFGPKAWIMLEAAVGSLA
jgi:TRAP-type transport system periplasmic protein